MKNHLFAFGIIFLFLSSVVPMTAGIDIKTSIEEESTQNSPLLYSSVRLVRLLPRFLEQFL